MKFKTVFQAGKDEFVEKKSRFIGLAFPEESEEAVLRRLDSIRKEYWNASHNGVYAYSVGIRKETQRFSDGGEPVHTAGLPILDLIRNDALHNVLIVVVRYFGGTLLGTGGLVRAYSRAARLAVEAAVVIEKQSCVRFRLQMEYAMLGRAQYGFLQEGYTIERIEYAEKAAMSLLVPEEKKEDFLKTAAELGEGRLKPRQLETVLAAEYEGKWYFYGQETAGEGLD